MDHPTLRPQTHPPLYLERAFSALECDQIIQLFEAGDRSPRSYQGLVDHRLRECDFVKLPDEWDGHFHRIAQDQMRSYFEREIDPRLVDRPMIYGYPVGVGFVPHHDQVTEVESARGENNGQPVIGGDYTLVLFCASPDAYDGGELHFPNHGWSYKPPAGSVVVYPTTAEYVHGVKPITRGVRHTVVCRMSNLRG